MDSNLSSSKGIPCFRLTLCQDENRVVIKIPYGALEGFVRSCVADGISVVINEICYSPL